MNTAISVDATEAQTLTLIVTICRFILKEKKKRSVKSILGYIHNL